MGILDGSLFPCPLISIWVWPRERMPSASFLKPAVSFLLKSSLNFVLIPPFMIASPMLKDTPIISLQDIPEGEDVRVVSLRGANELRTRLREMGFCEKAIIRRVAGGSAIVCQVCGTRVALNGMVAGKIQVERIPGNPEGNLCPER